MPNRNNGVLFPVVIYFFPFMVLCMLFNQWRIQKVVISSSYTVLVLSGYHADTPITIKAEAIRKADSQCH